jgi:hypothetical protein
VCSSDLSRFLETLRAAAALLAGQSIPGLLEQAQRAAGDADAAGSGRFLDAALEFCEYAPQWKQRVVAARAAAGSTLEVLKRYGRPDEKTGLPVPAPGAPAAPALPAADFLARHEARILAVEGVSSAHLALDADTLEARIVVRIAARGSPQRAEAIIARLLSAVPELKDYAVTYDLGAFPA